ncbi:MAG: GPW/gp25 family protein [Acidimicrobiales bacterium]
MQTDFIGAGWAFPVRVDATGAIALVRRERELEEAMAMILLTYPGERPMRPEFGSRLRDFVFGGANHETASAVAVEVRQALNRWEPRADVNDVRVTVPPGGRNVLHVDISYTPKGTNDRRNLVFPFYTIPEDGREY